MQSQQSTSDFVTLTPELDSLNGCRIGQQPAETLAVHARNLRFLDVEGCPDLRTLSIPAAAGQLHLSIRGCPRLSEIRLPAGAPGAVVHVQSDSGAPHLVITGALAEVDACWPGGEFRLVAPERSPMVGCTVAPADAALPSPVPDALVLTGGEDAPTELALLDAPRWLHVCGWESLEAVMLGASDLLCASFDNCTALRRVHGAGRMERLRFTACPSLSSVSGHGQSLRFAGSGAVEALQVDGVWEHLSLSNSGTRRLSCAAANRIALSNSHRLEALELPAHAEVRIVGGMVPANLRGQRLDFDERALQVLAQRALGGDSEAEPLLANWCAQAGSPKAWLRGLRALGRAAEGVRADSKLWVLRCRMHARAVGRQAASAGAALKLAAERWAWRLPEDLAQEAWDADLNLWLACRDKPEAAGFGRLLAGTTDPVHLATLARAVRRSVEHGVVASELQSLLISSLRRGRRQPPVASVEAAPGPYLDQVVQAVVATADVHLAEALAHYLRRRVSPEDAVPVLGRLVRIGLPSARVALMRLSKSVADGEVRARAMGAALAPAGMALFGTETKQPRHEGMV